MRRIKYYTNCSTPTENDKLIVSHYISLFDFDKIEYEIDEILEMYNVLKFFNTGFFEALEGDLLKKYKSFEIELNKRIGKFVSIIQDNNFEFYLNNTDRNYKDDFFKLINKYKVFKRLTYEKVQNFFKKNIYLVLQNKDMVNYYNFELRKTILESPNFATIFLDIVEVEKTSNNKKLYLPKSLSVEDKEKILINYINSDSPNINYLRIIVNIQKNDLISIEDRTKLLAKRKLEKLESEFFDFNTGIKMTTSVSFVKNNKETVVTKIDGHNWEFIYDLNWIIKNKDFPTLLNNFIYTFDYVDNQGRCNFVNRNSYMGLFESVYMRSKRDYPIGAVFDRLNQLTSLQMYSYYIELEKQGIRIEEIYNWFFNEYLKNEFKIDNFNICMPSKNSMYLEKCRTILPELDRCLKQFNYYVEDGYIDAELVEISSTHLFFKNVKSLINKKYVYANSNEILNINHLLFSDQCMLSYIEGKEEKYNTFFELIRSEKIKPEQICEFEQASLDKLITENYVEIDKNGYIVFSNINEILLLKDLNDNEVINYSKLSQKSKKILDLLIEKKLLKYESTLFSIPEQNYLNYCLNKSDFINSLDLRNKYGHGTQKFGNEEVHKRSYIIFLKIFALVIIKINDELCIKQKEDLAN